MGPASLLCHCIPLAGCILFVPGIQDLRLADIEPVPVSSLDLHDAWGELRPHLPPTYIVGKITVVTKADVHELAEQSELNIWADLTICKSGATVTHWPSVYFSSVDVNYNPTTEAIRSLYLQRAATHNKDELYTYEIYFVPYSERDKPKGVGHPWEYEPYDFTREPAKLCLNIGGGNMAQGHFVSNTVVIPSADIARAFQKVGH